MSERFVEHGRPSALEELRDELGDEFIQAAKLESRARRRRKLRGAAIASASALVLVPAALAVERANDEPSIAIEGANGDRKLVPAVPAPPPALSPQSDCPAEIQDFLRHLLNDPSLLPSYSDMPSYPAAGCPTIEELEATFEARSPPLSGPGRD